jgi:hypothetical protein
MIRPPLDAVFGALRKYGKPYLDERFEPTCCVAGTRLTTRVLEACGYGAYPRAMWVRAGNRAFVECVTHNIHKDEWVEHGVRYIEIDSESTAPKRFPAHLITICNGKLIDLTAGQFDRPEKNIHVPGTVFLDLPHEWTTSSIGKQLDGGGMLVYRAARYAMPDWRKAPDWNPARTWPGVARTLDALGVQA